MCVCVHFFVLTKSSFFYVFTGLERKLKASDEKNEQLSKDKNKLENDISDMMKASGDSSVQLTKMNEELIQKERYHTLIFHH